MKDRHESVLHAHHGNNKSLTFSSNARDVHAHLDQDNESVEFEQRPNLGYSSSYQLVLHEVLQSQKSIDDQVDCLLNASPDAVDVYILPSCL